MWWRNSYSKKRLQDCEDKIKEKEKEIKILDKILSEKICELSGLKNVEIENINLKTKVEELEDTLKEMKCGVMCGVSHWFWIMCSVQT